MRKLCLALPLSFFFSVVNAQNVGIGELSPGAKLTIKGSDILNRNFLVKSFNDDTAFYINSIYHFMNGVSNWPYATLNLNNKYLLPADNPQLAIVASGEHSGGFAGGSQSHIEFYNMNNPDIKFGVGSYTGNVLPNHWRVKYSTPTLIKTLLYIADDGRTGISTHIPNAKLQINHLSSVGIPTLSLFDSSTTSGPIIEFTNSGGAGDWQLRTTINTPSDQLDFVKSGSILASLEENGNFGIGITNPNYRLQIHNNTASTITYAQFTSLSTGLAATDGLLVGINGLSQAFIFNQEATKLSFGTASATRMTISETGNVGIGVDPPAEKLDVNGTIKLTGEMNRTSTGTSNLLPIAYGNVSSAGFINSGSGNFSVSKPGTGFYTITITGESYQFQQYTTVVTPVGSLSPIIVTTGSGGGSLQVNTFLASGTTIDSNFHFVVYKQ